MTSNKLLTYRIKETNNKYYLLLSNKIVNDFKTYEETEEFILKQIQTIIKEKNKITIILNI